MRLQVPHLLNFTYQLHKLQLISFQNNFRQLMPLQSWVFRITSDWPVHRMSFQLQDMHQRHIMPHLRYIHQTVPNEFKQLMLMPILPILQHNSNQMHLMLNYMQDMHANITYSLHVLR